jgi:hypothetical protein
MTDQAQEWKPLEEVALKYAQELWVSAPAGSEWQEAIDACGDHNQLMLDTIENTNPTLDAIIDELMKAEAEPSTSAHCWSSLVNYIFERAQVHFQEVRK